MNICETLGEWYWGVNPKYMEQNSSLYCLFQNEWGWNRASEFRGQRLASWILAHPSAFQEFHRLSYEARKFICMQNKFMDHNNIESLFTTLL